MTGPAKPRRRKSRDADGQGSLEAGEGELHDLYSSPEFLIRRAHQIASAAFVEACADLEITPSQYAALFALRQHANIGQNELGRLVTLDRSTTSLVVKSLRERGLVVARSDPADRRKSFLEATDKGRLLLSMAEQRGARASQAMMSVFDKRQATEFLRMLRMLDGSLRPSNEDL